MPHRAPVLQPARIAKYKQPHVAVTKVFTGTPDDRMKVQLSVLGYRHVKAVSHKMTCANLWSWF